jgi:hypothetical protein
VQSTACLHRWPLRDWLSYSVGILLRVTGVEVRGEASRLGSNLASAGA